MRDLTDRASRVDRVVSIVSGLFFLSVLCLMLFFQEKLSFAYSQSYLLKNLYLLPIALGALCLTALVRGHLRTLLLTRRWGLFLACYFPLLLLLQLLFTRSLWYHPGFDVLNVYTTAQLIAEGKPFAGEYFRLCPNNAPITLLQVPPLWVAVKLGLVLPYAVLPYLGAVMANISLLLAMLCIGKLTQSRFARLMSLFLGTMWIVFTLLTTVPYTDIFSIMFPVLALYLYLSHIRTLPKWFLIGLISFFGASIKPTVLIFPIALVMMNALRVLATRRLTWRLLGRIGAVLLAFVLGAIPGKVWQDASTAYLAGSAKPEGQLGMAHYLMLGMNGDTYGGHTMSDVYFSTSFATLAERNKADLARAWERVSGRSLTENAAFFATKAYKAFSDGLFAADTSFLVLEMPARQDGLSLFLRSLFHRRGTLHPLLVTVEQGIWLTILPMGLLALFGKSKRHHIAALLGLTLLGVGFYQLLFEVWPRYIYLYSPFFLILASLGLEKVRFGKAARRV